MPFDDIYLEYYQRCCLKDYLSSFSNFFHFSTSELREWRVLYM